MSSKMLNCQTLSRAIVRDGSTNLCREHVTFSAEANLCMDEANKHFTWINNSSMDHFYNSATTYISTWVGVHLQEYIIGTFTFVSPYHNLSWIDLLEAYVFDASCC